jgi:hypothetical protein
MSIIDPKTIMGRETYQGPAPTWIFFPILAFISLGRDYTWTKACSTAYVSKSVS